MTRFALKGLATRKLRSLLTMIAIAVSNARTGRPAMPFSATRSISSG